VTWCLLEGECVPYDSVAKWRRKNKTGGIANVSPPASLRKSP
jgi:hypothetical protein